MFNRRYHLHWPGLVYIGVTTLLGVGAINSQNNLLFIVFGLAVGALVFSGLMSGAMLMGPRVSRSVGPPVSVGEPLRLRYTVTNRNAAIPAFGLTIEEAPAQTGRSWADLLPRPRAFIAHVGRREATVADAVVVPERRGRALLAGVVISSSFPFGVFRKSVRRAQEAEIVVLPRIRPLRQGAVENLLGRSPTGETSSGRQGRGEEFWGLRDYVPGDSPRLVAWKSSARTDTLVVRQHGDHVARVLTVCLLLEESPDAEERNEEAISLAASVVAGAFERGMNVGLLVPQHGVAIAPAGSPGRRMLMLSALAEIDLSRTGRPAGEAQRRLTGIGHAACLVVKPTSGPHPLEPGPVPAIGADRAGEVCIDAVPDVRREAAA